MEKPIAIITSSFHKTSVFKKEGKFFLLHQSIDGMVEEKEITKDFYEWLIEIIDYFDYQ